MFEHQLGRTVLSADNAWFTLLTLNTNPVHFDAAYAARTEFGKPLVNSCLTLAIVTGQSVSRSVPERQANLGWDEVRIPIRCSKATRFTPAARFSRPASRSLGLTSDRAREDHGIQSGTVPSCSN